MAEILITGMDMIPKGFAYDVRIRGNGDVVDRVTGVVMGKAIGVPPHGRLIDATELEASDAIIVGEDAWNMVHNAPTVLEANN